VDLIILVPVQVDALNPAIDQARQAGIPVITANRRAGDTADVLTYVGVDNIVGGQLQGKMLVDMLGDSGRVFLCQGTLGSSSQIEREQGLVSYLAEHAPGITIVARQATNFDPSLAVTVTQNLLMAHPAGTLDAIVTQGPNDAVAVAETLINEGREELKGRVIGFDLPQNVVDAIASGLMYGSVVQDPIRISIVAVQLAYDLLTGAIYAADIPAEVPVALYIADKNNISGMSAVW
jgi:ABC-type sugar transport system substrate-binding protein